MGRRNTTSLASLLLVQRLVDVGSDPLKASEYWRVAETIDDLGALLGRSADEVVRLLDVDLELGQRIARLLDGATSVAFALEELEQAGVTALTHLDEGYPQRLLDRLGRRAPSMLYAAGSTDLLSQPGIGVVGSRGVDEDGADVARGVARLAVEHHHSVVSGGARGVDQLAMRAGLEAGGFVIGVLAESLLKRLREAETRTAVLNGSVCLCTPFKPSAGFSVANAMGRNKLIYALSEATVVVASDLEKGGTWAGAREAIRGGLSDVAVWTGPGAGEGNPALVGSGGRALPALSELFPLHSPASPGTVDKAAQLSLGL